MNCSVTPGGLTVGRGIRHFEPDGIYFITNRCAGGRFLLTPGPDLNAIIESVLARYAEIHDVELLGWMFMGNHFHLLARSRSLRLPDFMRDLQRKISGEVQNLREDWNSSVFPTRYNDQPVLDDAAVRRTLNYTLMNPVRAGLVRHPTDWPGVSSVELHRTGEPREVEYIDRRQLRRLRRKADDDEQVDPSRAARTYELQVTNPPSLADRTIAEAGAEIFSDLESLCRAWVDTQRLEGEGFAGPDRVRNQDPLARPDEPPEAPEPLCHTTSTERREEYRTKLQNVTTRYRKALEQWRKGVRAVSFPPGTYPPGWLEAVPYASGMAEPSADAEEAPGTDPTRADPPRGDPEEDVDPAA